MSNYIINGLIRSFEKFISTDVIDFDGICSFIDKEEFFSSTNYKYIIKTILSFDNDCVDDKFGFSLFSIAITRKLFKDTEKNKSWIKLCMNSKPSLLVVFFKLLKECSEKIDLQLIVKIDERNISLYNFFLVNIWQFMSKLEENNNMLHLEQLLIEMLLCNQYYISLMASDLWYLLAKFILPVQTTYEHCCLLMNICLQCDDYKFHNGVNHLDRLLSLVNNFDDKMLDSFTSQYDPLSYSRVYSYLNFISNTSMKNQILMNIQNRIEQEKFFPLDYIKIMTRIITSSDTVDKEILNRMIYEIKILLEMDDEDIKNEFNKFTSLLELLIPILSSTHDNLSVMTHDNLSVMTHDDLLLVMKKIEHVHIDLQINNSLFDLICIKILLNLPVLKNEQFENEYFNIITTLVQILMCPNKNYFTKNLFLLTITNLSLKFKHSLVVEKICKNLYINSQLAFVLHQMKTL